MTQNPAAEYTHKPHTQNSQFLPHNAMLTRYLLSSCFCLSVHLSVCHKLVLYRNDSTNRAGFWQGGFLPPILHIGADFRFEVPGQSSVGLIGGGRGQWLRGHRGECGARAYNGGLGAEPPAGSRGRAPGQGVRAVREGRSGEAP